MMLIEASMAALSEKFSTLPNPSTSVYGLAAVPMLDFTAASPSNMTSTKAQDE